jgi:hypothetical protein
MWRDKGRRVASVAIAETAALLRLVVTLGRRVRVVRHRTVRVRLVRPRRLDCKPAMHNAQVELHRLGEANAQPDRHDSGESAKKPIVSHATNISALAKCVGKPQRKTAAGRRKALGRGRRIRPGNLTECGNQRELGFGNPIDKPADGFLKPFDVDHSAL